MKAVHVRVSIVEEYQLFLAGPILGGGNSSIGGEWGVASCPGGMVSVDDLSSDWGTPSNSSSSVG